MTVDAIAGAILVDVLEVGTPEHYWQYEIRPSKGEVRVILQKEFQNHSQDIPHTFQKPAGAIAGCDERFNSEAESPDRKYVARCRRSSLGRDELIVTDSKHSSSMSHWMPKEWRGIQGFAWAPDSHSIAVLNHSEHYGKTPVEIFSGLSGHPVPHDTEFVNIIDLRSGTVTEYLVRKDVKNSFSRILSWSE